MAVILPRNLGMLLLAIWLILYGLSGMIALGLPPQLNAVLALLAGIPKLALRQLSHGITAFRDPGQWDEKFDELRRMIAVDNIPGPRIFTTGPHIDGENPAYPADSVVARDREEARRLAEMLAERGASA